MPELQPRNDRPPQTAARVQEDRRAAQEAAQVEAYARNPDAAFWEPRASLPPPPGLIAARAAAAASSLGLYRQDHRQQLWPLTSGGARESAARGTRGAGRMSKLGSCSIAGRYVPRDVLVVPLHHAAAAAPVPVSVTANQPAPLMTIGCSRHWAAAQLKI
jgi:hypothetical protein